jgi:hypothetical protein
LSFTTLSVLKIPSKTPHCPSLLCLCWEYPAIYPSTAKLANSWAKVSSAQLRAVFWSQLFFLDVSLGVSSVSQSTKVILMVSNVTVATKCAKPKIMLTTLWFKLFSI